MSPKEAEKFIEFIKGDRLEALFSVALAMGMRQGEALGLKWEDVDFESRTLRVRRALQSVKGGLELSELKSKNSRRDSPLVDSIISALKAHRTRQREEKMVLGKSWQEQGFVFASKVGTPLYPRNVVRKFHSLLKDAKLNRYRFHDLRHSCASLLLAQGVPLKPVSDILGHSQISITADFYAHIFDEQKREAMSVFDSILAAK
jgi:integrase